MQEMSKYCVLENLKLGKIPQDLGPRSQISGLGSWSIQKLIQNVTKSYLKKWYVLQSVTVIIKCDRKLLQSLTGITKY